MGSLPQNFRDRIEFVNPPTLDESIGMEMHCYEKSKGKLEVHPTWKGILEEMFEQSRSGFKLTFKNNPRNFQQGQQAQTRVNPAAAMGKGPLQCWGCGKNHMLK